MENTFIFASEKEVRFTKLLKFIVPTYLTSLFNTVYTIIDGIFVSTYVGTNALASINIVYPIVNVLTGIALVFATGGSAVTALHIGGNRKKEAECSFWQRLIRKYLCRIRCNSVKWVTPYSFVIMLQSGSPAGSSVFPPS